MRTSARSAWWCAGRTPWSGELGSVTKSSLRANIWRVPGARSERLPGLTPRPRAASRCRRRRSRSASRRFPARSGGLRAAGSRRAIRTSSTSTRSTRAGTSPPGRSRSSSPQRCEPHSDHCLNRSTTSTEISGPARSSTTLLSLSQSSAAMRGARRPCPNATSSRGPATLGLHVRLTFWARIPSWWFEPSRANW